MKHLILYFLLSAFGQAAFAQHYTIRDAYRNIPIEYLPATKAYLKDKPDTRENRDIILSYHNEEREFIKLNHDGSKLTGKLKMYTSGTDIFVVVEHSYCRSSKCENHFVILKKDGETFKDVSNDVLSDYILNMGKISSDVKKAMKESYGSNDYFKDEGLDDKETLRDYITWELDEQNGKIYLKESSLPFVLATYVWNEKKGVFDEE